VSTRAKMSIKFKNIMNGPEEKKLKVAKLVKQENVDDYDVEILEDKNKESEEEE
jgi:hypothetical protein